MNGRFLHHAAIGILALLLALTSLASRAAVEGGQQKTVDGLAVYLGVLPAEMLLGHPRGHPEREMHGGVPAGANRYHVVVALFDAASGKRVTNAKVTVGGASLGMAVSRRKAEPMLINNVITYGAYVTLAGPGPYRIQVEIRHPGASKPIEVEFGYPFAQ